MYSRSEIVLACLIIFSNKLKLQATVVIIIMIDLFLLLEIIRSPPVDECQSSKGCQTNDILHSEELHWSISAFHPNQRLWG